MIISGIVAGRLQLVQTYAAPITINGETGFIPTSILWQVNALVGLLSVIPLLLVRKVRNPL